MTLKNLEPSLVTALPVSGDSQSQGEPCCLLALAFFLISLHPSRSREGQLSVSGQTVKSCLSSTVGTGASTGTKLKEDSCVFNTLPTDDRQSRGSLEPRKLH